MFCKFLILWNTERLKGSKNHGDNSGLIPSSALSMVSFRTKSYGETWDDYTEDYTKNNGIYALQEKINLLKNHPSEIFNFMVVSGSPRLGKKKKLKKKKKNIKKWKKNMMERWKWKLDFRAWKGWTQKLYIWLIYSRYLEDKGLGLLGWDFNTVQGEGMSLHSG